MATIIPKVKGTCTNCLDSVFDIGCGTDCEKAYVEYCRMAGACGCTCKEMAWEICPTYETVDNCPCIDGIPRTGRIISGAYIGFSAPTEALLNIVAQLCLLDPTEVILRLYGSIDLLSCVTNTTGLALINLDGEEGQSNPTPVPITRDGDGNCTGGAYFLTAADLGISTVPPVLPETVSCTQTGGFQTLGAEFTDTCGNLICLCPFTGIIGGTFACGEPPNFCCLIDVTEEVIPCDGDSAFINETYTWLAGCSCVPSVTINIDGTDYVLTYPTPTPISHEVTPCTNGVTTVTVTRTVVYPSVPDCDFDCTMHNEVSVHAVTV